MTKKISKILARLGIDKNSPCVERFGTWGAKVDADQFSPLASNYLVLVTAITPTSAGEGKTTTVIALTDALHYIGYNAIGVIREPSLGPVFGKKGTATGGGKTTVEPAEKINLHFTGDFHAITTANNLLAAMVRNHQYHGLEPKIADVTWRYCADINDRTLRADHDLTAASEIMAVFCLARSKSDLEARLSRMIVGIQDDGEAVRANNIEGAVPAMMLLLKDAFKPNLVQTAAEAPMIIHGGPFANIAHGCSSVSSIKLARALSQITITEAGFGSDLGLEKYVDITCRHAFTEPQTIVIVASIRALKEHGNDPTNNLNALALGFKNLIEHHAIASQVGVPVIVALNRFDSDSQAEVNYFNELCEIHNFEWAEVTSFTDGWIGANKLAIKVTDALATPYKGITQFVDVADSVDAQLRSLCERVYNAKLEYAEGVMEKLTKLERFVDPNTTASVCVAKPPYPLEAPDGKLVITDVRYLAGANLMVCISGSVTTMPGLPKAPNIPTF